MFKKSLLALAAFVTLSTAQAGIMLDPFIGYNLSGSIDASTDTFSGVNYGARVGYGMLGLSGGVSYTMGAMDFETVLGATSSRDYTALGAYVAYEFPILLRAFATYNFSSAVIAADDSKSNGSGISIGVGWTGFPMIAINAEYRMNTYDEDETAAGVTSVSSETKTNDIFISVSLPFDL